MAKKEYSREEREEIKRKYCDLAGKYIDMIFEKRVKESLDIWREMCDVVPFDVIVEFSKELEANHSDEYLKLVDEVEDKVFDEMLKIEEDEEEF